MKIKLLSTIILLSFIVFSSVNAQTVNGKPIAEINAEYIQIVGISKLFSKKVNVNIDFGQVDKMFSAKDTQIKDENGRMTTFNSMIDALNFMSENGYEFVNAYAITISNQNVYHYMLRKKKNIE
jgi:hypothetical protein